VLNLVTLQIKTGEILCQVDLIKETKTGMPLCHDFLIIPNCVACNKEIQFVEGDVIYGEKWHHNRCLNFES